MAMFWRSRRRQHDGGQERQSAVGEHSTVQPDALVEEARALALQRRFRSAMEKLLVALDVSPHLPAALEMASLVIALGTGEAQAANPREKLEPQLLLDSRLDAVFCACESPGCTEYWLSAYSLAEQGVTLRVDNAKGGRCRQCGVTQCEKHAKVTEVRYYENGPPEYTLVDCSRCGGPMDGAPAPNGRRRNAS
jgi:hypothetical protein